MSRTGRNEWKLAGPERWACLPPLRPQQVGEESGGGAWPQPYSGLLSLCAFSPKDSLSQIKKMNSYFQAWKNRLGLGLANGTQMCPPFSLVEHCASTSLWLIWKQTYISGALWALLLVHVCEHTWPKPEHVLTREVGRENG